MPESGTMPGNDADTPADILQLALPRSQKVVLVMDLVESVRLMSADEAGTIARWRQFVGQASVDVLPRHHGRLVKSLGDGLMLEFEEPRHAVQAALTLHQLLGHSNAQLDPARQMHLRAGINATHVYTDALDIYGSGVNLAARLATLAGPGETVVSASVRDGLTDGLDAEMEDLGDCYLKHLEKPVRAFRVGPAAKMPGWRSFEPFDSPARPTLAIVPFSARTAEPGDEVLGEVIADEIIVRLSRLDALRVVSRLSTTAFRNRPTVAADIAAHLGAQYVVSGHYRNLGGKLRVTAELSEVRNGTVVWADALNTSTRELLSGEGALVTSFAEGIGRALVSHEVERARTAPLPSTDSCSLLMGAITLMHRNSASDFRRANDMLSHLAERHSRSALPQAWLAKWQVLQVVQGWAGDRTEAGKRALQSASRALDCDPQCSLAVALAGLVHTYLLGDLDKGLAHYDRALSINPSESLAWLFKSTWQAYQDDPAAAQSCEAALSLSPMDPMRYFYDSLAATALTASGHYPRAIELARRSLRANRSHASTHRILTIALSLAGLQDEATIAGRDLLTVEPHLTARSFLERYPGRNARHAPAYAEALLRSGIPR